MQHICDSQRVNQRVHTDETPISHPHGVRGGALGEGRGFEFVISAMHCKLKFVGLGVQCPILLITFKHQAHGTASVQ